MRKVSIIIPNYNGAAYLEDCLESIRHQTYENFEVIVVDDASTDGSAKNAEKKYPEVTFFYHEENSGFCKSCNDGVKAADGTYVILLNNDTTVHPDFVKELVRGMKSSRNIFSVQAKMVSKKEPQILDDAGDELCLLGWAFAPGKDGDAEKVTRKRTIFSACGGAVLYRKDLYESLGGLDEVHFAYFEDVDLGYRARLHGYENIVAPKSIVYHAGSASSGSRYNAFKARQSARNNVYFLYKNMPDWQIILNAPFLVAGFLIKTIFYAKKGLGKEYFSALKEGLRVCNRHPEKRVDFKEIKLEHILAVQARLIFWTMKRFLE